MLKIFETLKRKFLFAFIIIFVCIRINAQDADSSVFRWGNGVYYNLNIGESVVFNNVEVSLLGMENHYNQLKVGDDTLWLKVARRTIPEEINNIRVFIADNKNVMSLTADTSVHGLLTKDAIICLSDAREPLLDPLIYSFPVSFNDGFTWNIEEDSYPFSFYQAEESSNLYTSYPGIGINLHEVRGRQKHWLVAIENSKVVWVKNLNANRNGNQSSILLESNSQPGIYYLYNGLYIKNLLVRDGQKLIKGDVIGTAWGDESWGHVQFVIIYANKVPEFQDCFHNVVNGFPQLFGLYYQHNRFIARTFTRGKISFGRPRALSGNQTNTQEFEIFTGTGWITGKWNPADKVGQVSSGTEGNARLNKVLFEGTPAQNKNPCDYYEYIIAVKNGTYRIRAKVGDVFLQSWQKIEFEGIYAAVKELDAGEFDWTGERIVKVQDGTLNIRIYVDDDNRYVAGISEIVFQRVN